MVTSPTVTPSATVACPDYGSYDYSGSVNASGTYSLSLTFSLCRMDGYQYDGTYTLTGTPANMNITLGSTSSAFRAVQFNANNYSAIIGTLSMPGMRYSMAGSSSGSSESYTIKPTGVITAFDYIMLGEFTVGLTGLTVDYSSSIDAVTRNRTTSLIVNGKDAKAGRRLACSDLCELLVSKLGSFGRPADGYSGALQ
jgi:hypothetical protein